jgi:pimeloyl-ACP methyl ester carboxylesterase
MPDITANGMRFHIEDAGQGDPVILLHGFPDTSALWADQIVALTAAGYRAIAPDLRGRGQSDKPEGVANYQLSRIIQDVAEILDALGVARARVVGHDWGAAVAWGFAALKPERVAQLVAVSTPHPRATGKPSLEELRKGWYRLLFQFPSAETIMQQDDWYLMRLMLRDSRDLDPYIANLAAPGALTAALNWYRANLPPERLLGRSALPDIPAPTLGVFGADDPYLMEDAMRRSGEFVTGPWRYEVFPAAGHWVSRDDPDRFNRLLLEFFATR